ncbi:MAG: porin [Paracoccaceae bacterium]
MKPFALSALAFAMASTAALAQDFYGSGKVQYESLDFGNSLDMQVLTSDFTLGMAQIGGSGFGVELGLKAYNFSEFDLDDLGLRERGIFATVYYDSQVGRFSVGIPRAATASYFSFPSIAGSQLVSELGTALTATPDLLNTIVDDAPGLRYDGTFNQLSVAASFHRANDILGSGFDVDLLTAAGAYKMNDRLTLSLGLQSIDADGYSDTALLASAAYDAGTWGAKAMYGQALTGGAPLNADIDALTLTGWLKPVERLTIKADVARLGIDAFGISDSITAYGVNAEYAVWQDLYVGVGVADTNQDTDRITNAYLGYGFSF